jgi:hypothetical protein
MGFDKGFFKARLSGFDRVLFRGSLPRLSYPAGMKMYLIQNKILCKHYEDHVKAVSQKVKKKASLAPFQQQGLLVKYVYGREDKELIARAVAAERGITQWGCVRLDHHGDGPHLSAREDPDGDASPAVPDDLPLPHRSGIRLDACTDSDLVSFLHSRLHQRPGMVESPHGPGRATLFPPGQLFPLD